MRGGGDGWAQKLYGDEEVPFPGLIRAGEGRNDELDGELSAAATMAAAGGAQTGEGERERAEELQDVERKLAVLPIGKKGGQRRRFHGGRSSPGWRKEAVVPWWYMAYRGSALPFIDTRVER